MYAVGDFLVHPGQGVCRVDEIVDGPQASYRLSSVTQPRPTRISYPIAQQDRLRPVVSADEAREIINDYAGLEPNEFRAKTAILEEDYFKQIIRKGPCREAVRIVKTINCRIKECTDAGKKPPVAYGRVLRAAHHRSITELAVALACSPQDVEALIFATDSSADLSHEKIELYL